MVITTHIMLKGIGLSTLREFLLRTLQEMRLNIVEEEESVTSLSILAIEKRIPSWQIYLTSLIGPSLFRDRVGLKIWAFDEGDFISIKIEARLYIPELDIENPRGGDRERLRAAGTARLLIRELEHSFSIDSSDISG